MTAFHNPLRSTRVIPLDSRVEWSTSMQLAFRSPSETFHHIPPQPTRARATRTPHTSSTTPPPLDFAAMLLLLLMRMILVMPRTRHGPGTSPRTPTSPCPRPGFHIIVVALCPAAAAQSPIPG
jgi:hypothetical protein